MSSGGQETEAKFYVRDLGGIRSRLEELRARLIQQRVLETNIRFDLPGAPLLAQGRVLRLRRDTETHLTYKSVSTKREGVLSREEIELVVEDFEKAKQFLEALGYQTLFYYEKYRTTYEWNQTLIMLDELPYGAFVEIEGETVDVIHAAADQLHLNWQAAATASYHVLFERVRNTLHLSMQGLAFVEFATIQVNASHLGVVEADA
jgi:adenylate cyclase, class 2